MQLRHMRTYRQPADFGADGKFAKVCAVAFSPNSMRLAVATADRYIYLYDDNGEQKDRFASKASGDARNYTIKGLEFSPDSTKLAVAQTDNIVFVYKLGSKWGDKKTICNKLSQSAAVTSMCWPHARAGEVVFGLADGKMRVGILRSNKSSTLYHTNSHCVSTSAGTDGQSFVSGHVDGSIFTYTFPDPNGQHGPSQAQVVQVSYVPYALSWGEHICVGGNTGKVQFFDTGGDQMQAFEYGRDSGVREFTCAAFNPAGRTVVVGSFNKFYTYAYDVSEERWVEAPVTVGSAFLLAFVTFISVLFCVAP
jgi:intraflagellar transport protein 172